MTSQAAKTADLDLFTAASSLYGEGFAPFFARELKRSGCDPAVSDVCPLAIAAYFRALTAFAGVRRPLVEEHGRPPVSDDSR
jgi:hypothetical protein